MIIIGIDPGATGALAFFRPDTKALQVMDMPTLELESGGRTARRVNAAALAGILRPWSQSHCKEQVHVVVEQVGAMPKQGVSATFTFGRAAGVIEGVLAGLGLAYTLVPPAVWTRAVGVRGGKDGARARTGQLYPAAADLIQRVGDHGRADAILLAHWGYITGVAR